MQILEFANNTTMSCFSGQTETGMAVKTLFLFQLGMGGNCRFQHRIAHDGRTVPGAAAAEIATSTSLEPWIEESQRSRKEWLQASHPAMKQV